MKSKIFFILKYLGLRSPYTNKKYKYRNFDIGDFTYGKPEIIQNKNDGNLKIGKYCSIANGCKIFLGSNHRIDWISTYPFNVLRDGFDFIEGHPHSNGDVIIGNDVRIGSDVKIMSGVTIGDGAVIAAGSIVTKDVAVYSVVGGVPAKELKKRFNDKTIEELIKLSRRNLETIEIIDLVPVLQSFPLQSSIAIV